MINKDVYKIDRGRSVRVSIPVTRYSPVLKFSFYQPGEMSSVGREIVWGTVRGAMSSGGECPTFTTASVASSAATRVQCVSLTL